MPAQALKKQRDEAKAKAKAEADAKAAEQAAEAAERAKYLSFEQLKSGDYSGCTRLPVDEKNKEDWLTPDEFQCVQCFFLAVGIS